MQWDEEAGNMSAYECGQIRKLAKALAEEGVPETVARRVLRGGESVGRGASRGERAEWMAEAMRRMDALLDEDTRHSARERCACCLGGKRLDMSRAIARQHGTLEERVRAANEATFVFGHAVSLTEDGDVLVRFAPDGLAHYGCACLPLTEKPMPLTYCYCCGGHAKHHLQKALGRRLDVTVLSSALSSAGHEPCKFLFTILD
jgi:hypothetical protein